MRAWWWMLRGCKIQVESIFTIGFVGYDRGVCMISLS